GSLSANRSKTGTIHLVGAESPAQSPDWINKPTSPSNPAGRNTRYLCFRCVRFGNDGTLNRAAIHNAASQTDAKLSVSFTRSLGPNGPTPQPDPKHLTVLFVFLTPTEAVLSPL